MPLPLASAAWFWNASCCLSRSSSVIQERRDQLSSRRAVPLSLSRLCMHQRSLRHWNASLAGIESWSPSAGRSCVLSQMSTLPSLPRQFCHRAWKRFCRHPSWHTQRSPAQSRLQALAGLWETQIAGRKTGCIQVAHLANFRSLPKLGRPLLLESYNSPVTRTISKFCKPPKHCLFRREATTQQQLMTLRTEPWTDSDDTQEK